MDKARKFLVRVLGDTYLREALLVHAMQSTNYNADQAMFVMGFQLGRIYGEHCPTHTPKEGA